MMYKLKVLPSVRKEIIKIRDYIADDLCNLDASINLMIDIQTAFVGIKSNPNAFSCYEYEKELKHEYRKKIVNGYIFLYWIDEVERIVTVSYIFHTKMNYRSRLL